MKVAICELVVPETGGPDVMTEKVPLVDPRRRLKLRSADDCRLKSDAGLLSDDVVIGVRSV